MASQEMFPFSAADPTSMYGVESYMPDEVEDDDDAQAIGRLSGLESGSPETDARHDERDTGPFVRADAVERPVGSAPAPSGQRIRPLHADGTPHNSDVVELGPVKQISNEEVDGFKEQDVGLRATALWMHDCVPVQDADRHLSLARGIPHWQRYLPIANVGRLMKKCLPDTTKVSKDAKECVQECTSEFISFITSEAADKCLDENRSVFFLVVLDLTLSTNGPTQSHSMN